MKQLRSTLITLGKLAACALAYWLATAAAAAILTAAGVPQMAMPPGADPQKSGLITFALSPLLALAFAPLAAGMAGTFRARWLSLALLVFITQGVNTAIEARIFSNLLDKGGMAFFNLLYAGVGITFGAVVAGLFRPGAAASRQKFAPRSPLGWAWRGALAVAAFPVIYFAFGMCVAPFVTASYRAGVAGLVLPGFGVIIPVVLVRSALFLFSVLPVVFLWAGSRRGLVLALGWALAVTVGLFGLLGAYWFPTVLRVAHSLEITADSFVYALVVVMLFRGRAASAPGVEQATIPAAA